MKRDRQREGANRKVQSAQKPEAVKLSIRDVADKGLK